MYDGDDDGTGGDPGIRGNGGGPDAGTRVGGGGGTCDGCGGTCPTACGTRFIPQCSQNRAAAFSRPPHEEQNL